MTSYTIELNEKSKIGKIFMDFIHTFFMNQKEIKITENKSNYDKEFVKKIRDTEQNGEYKTIDPKNIWESLNLK